MSNIYSNIINGIEMEMSDDKFAESYTTFEQFKTDFFRDRKIEIYNVKEFNGSGNTTEFDFSYNEVPFHGVFLNLKNSGMNKNERDKYTKRMQVGSNLTSYEDDIPHFVIGSYNTYDKIMYFVVELKDYIKNKHDLNQKDYSSYWIDYGTNIYPTYEKGFNRNIDRRTHRIVVGIDNYKLQDLEDEELINKVFISKEYFEKKRETIIFNNQKKVFEINDNTTYQDTLRLKRNNDLRKKAFERENYTCELCGTRSTFSDKNGEEYFEGHHLIMYNVRSQSKYKYSLDIAENIVCLCPICHRKIHYSDEKTIRDCIVKLINKHNNLFNIYEFNDINKILEDYNRYERDDDNE